MRQELAALKKGVDKNLMLHGINFAAAIASKTTELEDAEKLNEKQAEEFLMKKKMLKAEFDRAVRTARERFEEEMKYVSLQVELNCLDFL